MEAKLMKMSYFDLKAETRLEAYADIVVIEKGGNTPYLAAIRLGGYPESVKGMSEAIYGGGSVSMEIDGQYTTIYSRVKQVDHNRRYLLNSIGLLPLYLDAEIFSDEEKAAMAAPGITLFKRTGNVPSDIHGRRLLGYDYGLMLYALTMLGDPLCETMAEKIMGLLDSCCLWGEYYDGDIPAGCRARPWESAINILSITEYIKRSKAGDSYMQSSVQNNND